MDRFYIQIVEVLITTLLLIFIWVGVQLVRPARSKRDWTLIGLVTGSYTLGLVGGWVWLFC